MITQEQIAKQLGITRTTVARALNGNANIKKETKEKVLKLAESLGYEKNYLSSSIARKKSKNIVAFLVKSKNKNFSEELKKGLRLAEEEYKKYNLKVTIYETLIKQENEQIELLKNILNENTTDGIIIVPIDSEKIKKLLIPYKENIPIISIGNSLGEGCYNIQDDYYQSGKIAGNIISTLVSSSDQIVTINGGNDKLATQKYLDGFYNYLYSRGHNIKKPVFIEDILNNIDKIINLITKETSVLYVNRYAGEIIKNINKIDKDILKNIKIVTNGLNPDIKELIKMGIIKATVYNELNTQGYLAGQNMFKLVFQSSKNIIKNYKVNSHIIFSENLEDF